MPGTTWYPDFYDWLAVTSASNWPDQAGTGMTVSVDPDVTWNGHATLRLDIPALSTGTFRVGTSGATVNLPTGISSWEGQKWLTVAMMSNNLAAVDNCNLFFGDSGFSNYYTLSFDEDNYPELSYQANEWMIKSSPGSFGVGAGSPTFSGAKRLRLNFTVASDASPTKVWIGGVGFMPKSRAKCVIVMDDGFDEMYSFAKGEAQTYGIPLSFAIVKDLVGTTGYMTEANLRELLTDDLFCLVNHGRIHTGYSTLGLSAYVSDVNTCRDYLLSLGAGDGAYHHAYIESQWDNTLLAALSEYKSCRAGLSTGTRNWQDKTIRLGDKRRYVLTSCIDLETGTSLADVQTQVNAAITAQQTCFIIGHKLEAVAGADIWATADFTSLLSWLRGKQKQGLIDCMRWTDWYRGLTQPALVA